MIVWIIAAVAVLFIVLVFVTGYVKASPDTAYIISGLRKTPKVLIGKAGVKIPFFDKKYELSLQLIPIDVKTSSAVPTADYINIKVDAAVNVKISDTPDLLNLAAQNFLNRKVDYIASVAREVLEGNMREIVGKMELQEMVSDRQKFANLVKENAELYERQREAEAKKYEQEQQAEAMKVQAEAEKFARAQEAEGIRAKGLAEAEAIRAKAVAEAEGIEKKAEAMTKMGKAAVLEMYFNALPDVVKNAAEPLTKVDKITMYGDGNSAKLTRDIMQTVTQVTDGLKESTGVDLQSVLSGFLGGKLADAAQPAPAAPPKHPRAPKQNAGTPAE